MSESALAIVTRKRQAEASDPEASAWVSANAGSGKTHVLIQRVLRLLLEGASPSKILCLTYTKAAAANMASRVFKTLSDWTSLDDEALTRAIVDCGASAPTPADLNRARCLFAHAIETPGGLKIQTLHAFCERLLKLFPFEANVAAHFRVIEERDQQELMEDARAIALRELLASPERAETLASVARTAGPFGFEGLLQSALGLRDTFKSFSTERFSAALSSALGLGPDATLAGVESEIVGGPESRARRAAWAKRLEQGSPRDGDLAAKMRLAEFAASDTEAVSHLFGAFFTEGGKGAPRGGEKRALATKPLSDRTPELALGLRAEQDRLEALRETWRAATTLERTVKLFAVAEPILAAYARLKGERGFLDFEDQIERALALVTQVEAAAWVMHKLDYGFDHILIDEAQDTSADQWRILEALCEELFAGASARGGKRTVFAVGDEKQSIFSFQGAAPEKFAEMRRRFAHGLADVGRPFRRVELHVSFRSAEVVLEAVDKTFANEAAWHGVSADPRPPVHAAFRADLPGVVELWPVLSPSETPPREDWRMPLDEPSRDDPAVKLANRIASVVAGWLTPGSRERVVERKGEARPIRPGDVMILVRKRGAFFEAMIRALKRAGVKTAGADRLTLRDHIAVMDLIAAGRASLAPDDDLSLACVLKSPFIGLSDDDLLALTAERRGSLTEALAASRDASAIAANARIEAWRNRARALGPYAFYARLIGEDGGRKALFGRLGADASDPIDEFLALALAHESREAPSLANFLAEVEETETAIKRDMEAESDGVRVLTVHASKGLEAPIVFLPDTCSPPVSPQHSPKLLRLPARPGSGSPLFVWSGVASEDSGAVAAARQAWRDGEAGEHRRLLYVAMTRAKQRVIVAGFEGAKVRPPDCWHELIRAGVASAMIEVVAHWGGGDTIHRLAKGVAAESATVAAVATQGEGLPAWASEAAKPERAAAPLAPSRAARRPEADAERLEEGRLAHALAQYLPDLPIEARPAAAARFLNARGERLPTERREAIAASVVATIALPELAELFGANSRAEVALAGALPRIGEPPIPIGGRIDRLAVGENVVTIADFKSGAASAAPPASYVLQLALYRAALAPLYPERRVEALLIYLDGPTVVRVSAAELERAMDRIRRGNGGLGAGRGSPGAP